jgi:mevalonate kinase
VPVAQVRAQATVMPDIHGSSGQVRILAPDIGLDALWRDLSPAHPIGAALAGLKSTLDIEHFPACTLKVTSSIPLAAGLGSGAAVSVAILRAMSGFLGKSLTDEQVSALAYEVDKIYHGTPSGIDNTVVTYGLPVYFVKDQSIETFHAAQSFTLVIGDTGLPAPTKESVSDVRRSWQSDPQTYNRLFAAIGSIANTARQVIESGHPERLGPLMEENHDLLVEMGVSSSELDRLVGAARGAGALGAKLSGGGRGGNMIALVETGQAGAVEAALHTAGATRTIRTEIGT